MSKKTNIRRIFLAEDDEDDQEFIREAIRKVNPEQELEIASNGKELLDSLQSLPDNELPCLLVIDLNMPVMDGWQTLEALKKMPRYNSVPRVIFTTSDTEGDKQKAAQAGAAGYLTKPSNMTEVVKSVTKILSYCH